jgi:glucokinase
MSNTVLGVDIGGSHITAALVDLETKVIVAGSEKREFVDSNGSAEEILSSWCTLIDQTFKEHGITQKRIGIAMPGPFDYVHGISLIRDQEKFRSLYQMNLKEALAERLGMEPEGIVFINDAAAFLQGEVFGGAAMDFNPVLGLTLGTGLGAARSLDGEAHDAALWNSPFKDGIAEDYLSTRWFLNAYQKLTGEAVRGVKELTELQDSEEVVHALFQEFAGNLATFIRDKAQEIHATAVVLGGNISNANEYFLPALTRALQEKHSNLQIRIAELKEDAALIGAASCLRDMEKPQ